MIPPFMSTKLFIFYFIVLAFSSIGISFPGVRPYDHNKTDTNDLRKPVDEIVAEATLGNTLFALEKVVFFFYKRYNRINFDGLFGVRMVQAELRRILIKEAEDAYPELHNDQEIKEKIKKILKLTYETIELALPLVKKKEREYYQSLSAVIDSPWKVYELEPQLTKKIDEKYLPWTRQNGSGKLERNVFDEELSDKCMASVIGSSSYKPCSLDLCWKQMTKPDANLYYTTHQILWLQLAIKHGCMDQLKEKAKQNGGIDNLFRHLCTNVIFSMETIAGNSFKTSVSLQDIFLEQGCLCGSMGFMDAVRQPWLAEVLKWQHPKLGCFMDEPGRENGDLDSLYNDLDIWMYNNKQIWKKRRLLYDVSMGDDCSSHKSAVGASFLAIYLRLFLDPMYIENKLWPNIYGPGYVPPGKARKKWMLRFSYLLFVICFLFVYFILFKRRSFLKVRILRMYYWTSIAKQTLLRLRTWRRK